MLIVYAITTIGIANLVLKKKLGSEHFLVAGRSLPLAFVIAVVLGDMVGGPSTVGVCQRGYSEGIGAIFYPLALGAAMCVFATTMSARFRRLRAVTVPQVIGKLFDEKTRLTTGVVIAVAYFFIGISQILAGGALLSPLLGIDLWIAKLITALIFVAIIVAGGLRSIALVNMIQVGVIFTGMLISLVFSLVLVGGSIPAGVSRIWTELPPSFWDLGARNPLTVSGEALGTIFAIFAAQAAITGIFAAKNQKAAVVGAWSAGILYFPIGFAFVIIGLCSRLHFGDSMPYGLSAAPAMMLEFHPVLAGVSLCGLFAAVMSTGPLVFLAPIQILVKDIYSPHIDPGASDRKLLLVNRLLAIALLSLGWILSVTFQEILKIQYWAFAFRAGIAVVLLSLVYLGSRRVSEDGAFWGLIAGVVVFVGWNFIGSPYGIHVAIPSMAAVFVATMVISSFRKRRHALPPEVEEALKR
jgi:solute:Na+ symporter, SSS family